MRRYICLIHNKVENLKRGSNLDRLFYSVSFQCILKRIMNTKTKYCNETRRTRINQCKELFNIWIMLMLIIINYDEILQANIATNENVSLCNRADVLGCLSWVFNKVPICGKKWKCLLFNKHFSFDDFFFN